MNDDPEKRALDEARLKFAPTKKDLEPNWHGYETQIEKNNQLYAPYISRSANNAFEFGVLAVKNLYLLNGGGLVALPAIVGISAENVAIDPAPSAICFSGGLVLAVLCNYATHLNWSHLFDLFENEKANRERRIEKAFIGRELVESDASKKSKNISRFHSRAATTTYWIAHLAGIASLGAFCAGIFKLLSSFSVV